jgi:adenosylcobinamide amidohydrolase
VTLTCTPPWLEFDLGEEMQVLSFAPHRPGAVTARHILWREVRNADLPPDLDACDWLAGELSARQASGAVAFLTSRTITKYVTRSAQVGEVRADAVVTIGLSNAERIGTRLDRRGHDWGTINIALRLSAGLTPVALIEAMSIVAQARTAAVMDAGHDLPTGRATGTGTDCIAVAAPQGAERFVGLHTEAGEAIGRATYEAVLDGARDWMATDMR